MSLGLLGRLESTYAGSVNCPALVLSTHEKLALRPGRCRGALDHDIARRVAAAPTHNRRRRGLLDEDDSSAGIVIAA